MHDREHLDRLGQDWCNLPQNNAEAARQALLIEIFTCIYELFRNVRAKDGSPLTDALTNFFRFDWPKFDAKCGSLSSFAKVRLQYRLKDDNLKDFDGTWATRTSDRTGRETMVKQRHVSMDAPMGEDSEETIGSQIPGRTPTDEEVHRRVEMDDKLLDLLSQMLNMNEHLTGRARNRTKENYYRLFFTDNAVLALQTGCAGVYLQHERDLFTAMKLTFLDYLLLQMCRTAAEISRSDLKPYGELVEGQSMEEPPKQPLPLDVFSAYLLRIEQTRAGRSAISMQRKEYEKFVKEHLKC